MILEPNVPNSVRNWARCQVNLRRWEAILKQWCAGEPVGMGEHFLLLKEGRENFIEKVVKPKTPRLERRCRRYRAIARAIEARVDPRQYLLGKREMPELIGSTLHYSQNHAEVFETLFYSSRDGEQLFTHGDLNGLDALDLLARGFGRGWEDLRRRMCCFRAR